VLVGSASGGTLTKLESGQIFVQGVGFQVSGKEGEPGMRAVLAAGGGENRTGEGDEAEND